MFPLGKVLFPGGVLLLHVFEDRYKTMMNDVLGADGYFGVVLIERGNEVGGGDVRTSVGTIARVREARQIGDGRWFVSALGNNRLRIIRWLVEAPYPRALVTPFPDTEGPVVKEVDWVGLNGRMRRVLSNLLELGDIVTPATFELGNDPALWSFRLADLGPFTEVDRQKLLEVPSELERKALLSDLLEEVDEIARLRLKIDEEPREGGR